MNKTAALNKLATAVREYIQAEQNFNKVAQLKQAQMGKSLSNLILGKPWMEGANTSKLDAIKHMLGGARPQGSFYQDNEMFGRLLGALLGGAGGGAVGAGAMLNKDKDNTAAAALGGAGGSLLGAMLGSRAVGGASSLFSKLHKEIGKASEGSVFEHPLYSGYLKTQDKDIQEALRGALLMGNVMNPLSIPLAPISNQFLAPVGSIGNHITSGLGSLIPR